MLPIDVVLVLPGELVVPKYGPSPSPSLARPLTLIIFWLPRFAVVLLTFSNEKMIIKWEIGAYKNINVQFSFVFCFIYLNVRSSSVRPLNSTHRWCISFGFGFLRATARTGRAANDGWWTNGRLWSSYGRSPKVSTVVMLSSAFNCPTISIKIIRSHTAYDTEAISRAQMQLVNDSRLLLLLLLSTYSNWSFVWMSTLISKVEKGRHTIVKDTRR